MAIRHKLLRGAGSGKYLGFATQKVDRLAKESARARAPSRTKRYTTDAGMVDIKVSIQGKQHYVKIKRKQCPPFLSGFCDAVYEPVDGVPSLTPIYQIDDPSSSDPDDTIAVFRRFYPSPATPEADREWRDERGLARDPDAAKEMASLKSSMYSGEMRKVIQVLQGMNVELQYFPSFVVTHGIFVAENGQRWIIEISSYGVLAWPMTMCRNPVVGRAGAALLPYTPISTPKPTDTQEARDAGRIFELIDQPTMQQFYVHAPMFPFCGWAFSADGHKAANVCWDKFGGFEHVHTYLFEITIEEAEGRPATATLTQVDTGIYHGDRIYTQVKFPTINGSLYSFDPLYGVFVGVISNAPIYTFFDGDRRIDVYYENDPFTGGTQTFDDDFQDSCGGINISMLGRELKKGSTTYDPTPHLRITGLDPLPAALVASSLNYRTYTLSGAVGQHTTGAGVYANQVADIYAMTTDAGAKDTVDRPHYAFIVPYGEREAFYLARRQVSTTTYIARSVSVGPFTVEPFYQRVAVCPCGVGGEPVIVGAGAPQPIVHSCDGYAIVLPVGSGGPYLPGGYTGAQTSYQISGDPSLCGTPGTNPGNCNLIPGVYQILCDPIVGCLPQSFPGQVEENTSFSVEFHGSGEARAVFYPLREDDWFFFLDFGQTQYVVAHRDAFVPGKMIVSEEVDLLLGSELYSTADAYPVNEAGKFFNLNLVGVP